MESFRRRDLAIFAIQLLPQEIVQLIRRYHVESVYVTSNHILGLWKMLNYDIEKYGKRTARQCEWIARKLSTFLLASRKTLRVQGMSRFQRSMLYASSECLHVKVEKLQRKTNVDFICRVCDGTGWHSSPSKCSCCHPPDQCFGCKGNGQSRGYYRYDVVIAKVSDGICMATVEGHGYQLQTN